MSVWAVFVSRGVLALSLLWMGSAPLARAEDDGSSPAEPPTPSRDEVLVVPGSNAGAPDRRGSATPQPALDDLLHLPSGFDGSGSRQVAGASETEWRRRFVNSTRELDQAKGALEATKHELDGVAEGGSASQWSVAPPGNNGGEPGNATSPLSFKLRQQLKRDRERIEAAEKALRELRIEADLAGVPQSWRAAKASSDQAPPR